MKNYKLIVIMSIFSLLLSCSGSNLSSTKQNLKEVNINQETQTDPLSETDTNLSTESQTKTSPEEVKKSEDEKNSKLVNSDNSKSDKYSYDPIQKIAKNDFIVLTLPNNWLPGIRGESCDNFSIFAETDASLNEEIYRTIQVDVEPNSQMSLQEYIKEDSVSDTDSFYQKVSTSMVDGIEMEVWSTYNSENIEGVLFIIFGIKQNNIYKIYASNDTSSVGPNMDPDIVYILEHLKIK